MLWGLSPLSVTHTEYHTDNACHGGNVSPNRGHQCWLVGDEDKTGLTQLSPSFSMTARDRSTQLCSDAHFGLLRGIYLDFTLSFNPDKF